MIAVNNKTDEGQSDSEEGELLLTGGEVEVWGRGGVKQRMIDGVSTEHWGAGQGTNDLLRCSLEQKRKKKKKKPHTQIDRVCVSHRGRRKINTSEGQDQLGATNRIILT